MNNRKIVAIVQARMGSSRLPQKVLMPLAGKPALYRLVERLKYSKLIDQIVIATTDESQDDSIREFCTDNNLDCYNGSENDVLDRYYQAAMLYKADIIVRITGDCPVVDPLIVDEVIMGYIEGNFQVYSLSGEFPDGLDCSVYAFNALKDAWENADLPSEREHVGPYMSNHPEKFARGRLFKFKGLEHHRWTLDEENDYYFLAEIYNRLYQNGKIFYTDEILELLDDQPHLMEINSGITRNEGYIKSLSEDKIIMNAINQKTANKVGQKLYKKAKHLIPGGTQLLSKRPEQFAPDYWPAYYKKASGVTVTDLDGNTYIDMGIMGIGASILGYSDSDVDKAVHNVIDQGIVSSLNTPVEVELAELLCELHPWAQQVRYARSGGEAMAMAIRIARASSGKDLVAFSGYHGWMDWYLAANLGDKDALDGHLMPGLPPAGVPRSLKGTALPFHYNCLEELEAIVEEHPNELGVIVMEPQRGSAPEKGFLEAVKQIAKANDAVLVFDEITTGFRVVTGGIHLTLGVEPDVAVFAKAMANGYAMAAVIGTKKVMEATQKSFISSTNWTEAIGPTAAIATIRKHQQHNVGKYVQDIGRKVKSGWKDSADRTGLILHISGLDSLAHFSVDHPDSLALTTLFIRLMLDRGFLAFHQFKPSFAHTDEHLNKYFCALDNVFKEMVEAIELGDVLARIDSLPARTGFYRLTS